VALGKKEYEGGQTVTIGAPLYGKDGLPMFVKAGAIIPMMPEMNYIGEKPVDLLTLDIYPVKKGKSQFALLNRKRPDGKTQKSVFECIADGSNIEIEISNSKVKHELWVHMTNKPCLTSRDSFYILLEKRPSGTAEPGYKMLYGLGMSSQLIG